MRLGGAQDAVYEVVVFAEAVGVDGEAVPARQGHAPGWARAVGGAG